MTSSINFIHSNEKIDIGNGDYIYKLKSINGKNYWIQETESNLFRVYSNTSFGSYDLSSIPYKKSDYILAYNKSYNYINHSENFLNNVEQKDIWVNHCVQKSVYNSINISNLKTPIYGIITQVPLNSKITDSYISQSVYTNSLDVLKFSVYVCALKKSHSTNIALSLHGDSSDCGVYVKTNFQNPQSIEKLILDKNYNIKSNDYLNRNSMASITQVESTDSYDVYKLSLVVRFDKTQQTSCKLNLLNKNGGFNFEYNTNQTTPIFASGFQLELFNNIDNLEDVLISNTPYVYNNTDKPVSQTYLDKIYFVNGHIGPNNHIIISPQPIDVNIHYALSGNNTILTYDMNNYICLENIQPNISNSNINDILLMSNVLDLSSNIVKFGSTKDTINDPLYSIYYDKSEKVYKIKMEEYFDNGKNNVRYDVLQSNKSISNTRKMVQSLIYNQGYFETWSNKGKCVYKHGYNTGGGHNFWKK